MVLEQKMKERKYSCNTIKSKIYYLIFILIIPIFVFSVGVAPLLFFIIFLYLIIPKDVITYLTLSPLLLILSIFIFAVSEIVISGLIIKVCRFKYNEGIYEYSFNDLTTLKWSLICQLYTPIRKIFEIIPMGKIMIVYYRLLGMRIGNNSLVGGVIKDPCMTEIGDNVTIGEYSIIYAHMHNKSEGTLTIKPIKIGNNCIIGAGAIIMPGVVMKDNSIIAAGGVATINQVLEKGKIYGGNPARVIKKEKK